MVNVSCRASLVFRKTLYGEDEDALKIVKDRLKAVAMQAALDLKRDGYAVDLEVDYLTAYEE